MKKLEVVKMQDFKDCGVTSMLSIIKYYNGYISLERLRELTHTDYTGTNAFYIVNAFRKIGFDSIALNIKEIDDIKYKLPAIVQISLPNQVHHFVVLYSINKNSVTLMDPSVGKKVLEKEEFEKLFTGNVIVSLPISNNIILEEKIKISKLFGRIMLSQKSTIIKLIIISIILSVLSVILSYYFKISSMNMNNLNVLKTIIFIFFLFTLLKIFLEYVRCYYENHLNLKIDIKVFKEFINHLFNLPLKNVKSRTTGEVMTRIKELDNIKELFSSVFIMLFLDLLLAITSLIVLYILNNKLFYILLFFIIIYLLFGLIINKIIYRRIVRNIDYETDMNSLLIENINMFTSIKNLNITNIILKRIEYSSSNYYYDTFKFNNLFNNLSILKSLIIDVSFFIINSVGFIEIYNKNFALIDLVTFNMLITYSISPIKNIVELMPKFNYIKASIIKIGEFLSIKEETLNNSDLSLNGFIDIKNLTYSFNELENIIEDFSCSIKSKDKVFLCGSSGTGKSTLCNLLYRNIEYNKGQICLDKINIKDLNLSDIRNNILYVSQNESLFCGTIKDNIVLSREVCEKEFISVTNICCIDKIVSKKNVRYDSLIDPDHNNLSGGEKQRIILARGLLKHANILILDEALSEVDYELEKIIINNILDYYKDLTIIYVSHKDHSSLFDKVVNMEDYNVQK